MSVEEMSCAEVVALVTDYIEDALSPETRRRFEVHVHSCDGCTAYIEQMRLTIASVGSIDPDAMDPAAKDKLLQAFRGWRSDRPRR